MSFDYGWRLEKSTAKPAPQQTGVHEGKYVISDDFSLPIEAQPVLEEALERLKRQTLPHLELIREICETNGLILGKASAERIARISQMNTQGYGVLDLLLSEAEFEEISVAGINEPIRAYHKRHGWLETNAFFTSEEFAINVVNKMARPLGRRVSYQHPRLNANLPDGSRLHASIRPVNLNRVEITIRKFREKPYSVLELVKNSTLSFEAASLISMLCKADVSMLIAGNTGSGKTTLLNALFEFVPENERVIIAEETPEINIPQPHRIRMVASPEIGVQLKDIVHDTLRMRPDRMIIGEVRTQEETQALFDSLLAGQAKANYATFHAQTAQEALNRLRALGIMEADLGALGLIIVVKRISVIAKNESTGKKGATENSHKTKENSNQPKEMRRVTEISEVQNGRAEKIYEYDPRDDRLKETPQGLWRSSAIGKALVNYAMTRQEFLDEMRAREARLRREAKMMEREENIRGNAKAAQELKKEPTITK